jgi:isoamylase
VGNFPVGWAEWNGKYRDTMRDFWRGSGSSLGEFAYRFTGSSDLYELSGRRPTASINFITAHDGFTLRDLVSYNKKHNVDNQEDNRDGENHNRSWNHGVEGMTDDLEVNLLRARQQRNLLATLFLSQGVPMLLAGDEIGRTQLGNNNAYCQDNEISWIDWEEADLDLLDFTRRLIHFYREHPVFRQRQWFLGQPIHGNEASDIGWFTPDGQEMAEEHWGEDHTRSLGIYLNGGGIKLPDRYGNRITDTSYLLLFHAHFETIEFTIPSAEWGVRWRKILDTSELKFSEGNRRFYNPCDQLLLEGLSLVVLEHVD